MEEEDEEEEKEEGEEEEEEDEDEEGEMNWKLYCRCEEDAYRHPDSEICKGRRRREEEEEEEEQKKQDVMENCYEDAFGWLIGYEEKEEQRARMRRCRSHWSDCPCRTEEEEQETINDEKYEEWKEYLRQYDMVEATKDYGMGRIDWDEYVRQYDMALEAKADSNT